MFGILIVLMGFVILMNLGVVPFGETDAHGPPLVTAFILSW